MARTLAPPPTDRAMWRRLLALCHPDGHGDHALFVWASALRETWERSDKWIGDDLGVKRDTVAARRREMVKGRQVGDLPEYVYSRDGQKQPYSLRKKPAKKPDKGEAEDQAGNAAGPTEVPTENGKAEVGPQTVTDILDSALEEAA